MIFQLLKAINKLEGSKIQQRKASAIGSGLLSMVKNLNGDLTAADLKTLTKMTQIDPKKSAEIKDDTIFKIGQFVKLQEDYNDRLNDIYLERGEEIEIVEKSNNHVVAAKSGELIGHIPKRCLEGFVDLRASQSSRKGLSMLSENILTPTLAGLDINYTGGQSL